MTVLPQKGQEREGTGPPSRSSAAQEGQWSGDQRRRQARRAALGARIGRFLWAKKIFCFIVSQLRSFRTVRLHPVDFKITIPVGLEEYPFAVR